MKIGYLLWFIFFFTLICSQLALYGLPLDKVHTLENTLDPKVSKSLLVAREKQGTHSNGNVNPDTEGDGESIEAMDRTTDTEKTQRGKGTYGGANVVHKRPYEKAAASVLKSPLGLFLLHILPHLIA